MTESALTLFLLVLMTRPLIDAFEALCFCELFIPVMTAATIRLSCSDRTELSSLIVVATDLIRRFLFDLILSILSLCRRWRFLSPIIFDNTRRPAWDSLSFLISLESYHRVRSEMSTPFTSFVWTELTLRLGLDLGTSRNNLDTNHLQVCDSFLKRMVILSAYIDLLFEVWMAI